MGPGRRAPDDVTQTWLGSGFILWGAEEEALFRLTPHPPTHQFLADDGWPGSGGGATAKLLLLLLLHLHGSVERRGGSEMRLDVGGGLPEPEGPVAAGAGAELQVRGHRREGRAGGRASEPRGQ